MALDNYRHNYLQRDQICSNLAKKAAFCYKIAGEIAYSHLFKKTLDISVWILKALKNIWTESKS